MLFSPAPPPPGQLSPYLTSLVETLRKALAPLISKDSAVGRLMLVSPDDSKVRELRIDNNGNLTIGVADDSAPSLQTPLAAASVKTTVFTASGTFTPDPKMLWCEVTAFGGGGAGGGAVATASTVSIGLGGNGGAKAILIANAATIGGPQAVTIGAGGTGVSGAAGNAGGSTTLGSLLSAKGGEGGSAPAAATAVSAIPSPTSKSTVGTVLGWTHIAGAASYGTLAGVSATYPVSGANELGGEVRPAGNADGIAAAANSGAGGGGILHGVSQPAHTGGAGGSGLMIIKEYLSP